MQRGMNLKRQGSMYSLDLSVSHSDIPLGILVVAQLYAHERPRMLAAYRCVTGMDALRTDGLCQEGP